jgi:hypothetical protein
MRDHGWTTSADGVAPTCWAMVSSRSSVSPCPHNVDARPHRRTIHRQTPRHVAPVARIGRFQGQGKACRLHQQRGSRPISIIDRHPSGNNAFRALIVVKEPRSASSSDANGTSAADNRRSHDDWRHWCHDDRCRWCHDDRPASYKSSAHKINLGDEPIFREARRISCRSTCSIPSLAGVGT